MSAKPALVRPLFASDLEPDISLWIIRLCLSNSAALAQISDSAYSEEIRQLIGIKPYEGNLLRPALKPLLRDQEQVVSQICTNKGTSVLAKNVAMLSRLVGFDEVEQAILSFTALSQHHVLMSDIVGSMTCRSLETLIKVLQAALCLDEKTLHKAIHSGGQLQTTRVLSIDTSNYHGMRLEISEGLQSALFTPADDIQQLMSAFLERSPLCKLLEDDFGHLRAEAKLLRAYLTEVGEKRVPGVNVLIYGPPGTGKTEFARWIAQYIGKDLYQVRATDNQGNAFNGPDRLTYFQLSQRFLQNGEAFILFDEIEDVFPSSGVGNKMLDSIFPHHRAVAGKMFINSVLESNPVPSIWIANDVSQIDKAYLRRFDFSFEMGVPPISNRRKILERYLRRFRIPDTTMHYLAQQEELSPAQIEKAAKILRLSGRQGLKREEVLLQVVYNSMALLEQAQQEECVDLADGHYHLEYLNPDCDLRQLTKQIKRSKRAAGALCLYGPPGTGKTAFARYLAHEADRPLLVRRASDILASYVGESEQNIAAMFDKAQSESAILLLDEADSFLRDRKSARNSWEVTAVNELLTQMERFEGIFICSTNLVEHFDKASLRRFALKIKFNFLTLEQRWGLFVGHVPKLPTNKRDSYRHTLAELSNLTPGDFATIRRQCKLLHVELCAEELLNRLAQESRNKGDALSRPIGFLAQH